MPIQLVMSGMLSSPFIHGVRTWVLNIGALVVVVYSLDLLLNSQVPMVDVGEAREYAHLVGKKFRTQQELRIFGITADRHYAKRVDYVMLVTPPGFGGREIVTRDVLPKGSVVQIVGVLRSTVPFLRRVEYVVRVKKDGRLGEVPMRVNLTGAIDDANVGLPEGIFVEE